eukprot:6752955-Pyramimonas_sp.AAC.2
MNILRLRRSYYYLATRLRCARGKLRERRRRGGDVGSDDHPRHLIGRQVLQHPGSLLRSGTSLRLHRGRRVQHAG